MATKKLKTKMTRLETIADMLESGELELEKAMTLYEEGMKLAAECGAELDGAYEKVMALSAQGEEIPYEEEVEA
ncbi:MAG: exodeoxyribonuclease VII small subunit [Eubacterium sp.]|nr:exodeoxyribonuclease VII small subunit [Eubacterium sp.]